MPDIAKQEREIARLKEELKSLNEKFDEEKKKLGLPEGEEVKVDESELTPEVRDAMQKAKKEAEAAGRAAAEALEGGAASSSASRRSRQRRGSIAI